MKGNFIESAITSHFKPEALTTYDLDERTASRYYPLAFIFLPLRRSKVSSAKSTSGFVPEMRVSSMKNKIFAAKSEDHFVRFKRWWYFEKPTSLPNPIARSAEHTVRLPVQISVPSRSVRAFFQEGFEKSTEKGSKTDKMLCDRESIGLTFIA